MPTPMREEMLPLSNLLVDPNNFRFHDRKGFVVAADTRYHEASVQSRALQRLREDAATLKKSIMSNGYMPIERIIVRPYPHQAGWYVVIEGNRRVAAATWIIEDRDAGVDIPQSVIDTITRLPCVIVEEEGSDDLFRNRLMGIRHVSGISNWGGYQRAKLIATLRDDLGQTPQDIADSLGLTVHEVNRRYRAFKALQQMKEDEEFAEYATPDLYPLFHEAVSIPAVREWLGWDDASFRFEKDTDLKQFYQLLCPRAGDEEEAQADAKISSREEMRRLGEILPKPEARRVLLDATKQFQDALSLANQDQMARAWASEVGAAVVALDSMGVSELKRLTPDDIALLRRISDKALERIRDLEQLVAS